MAFDPDEYLKEPFDPDAYLKGAPEGTYGGALKSAFAGVGSMADTALSTLAGSGAALFGDDKEAIRIADELEARKKAREQWANPQGAEFSTGQKLVGALATLPMQVVGAGMSPATTVDTMLKSGETTGQALKAGAVDALGNIVGIAVPGWKQGSMAVRGLTGAAAGAGQDYATKAAIQAMTETEKGKAAFEPSFSDAAVAGLIGGGMGAAMGSKLPKTSGNPKVKALQEAQAAREAAKSPKAQGELFAPETEGLASPYDAGQAGVTEPITPQRARAQMELGLRNDLPETMLGDERGVITPELPNEAMQLAKERAGRAEVVPEGPAPVQADLFAPETNVHRAYTDIRAATEAGGERPLTRTEFEQVHQNLAKEPVTAHEMPPDMDTAYQSYLDQVSGKQADMFDIGSRQEAFGQQAFKEQVARQLEEHPFVKNAEKALAKQEKFVSDLKEQVAAGTTRATALVSEIKALEKAQEKVAKVRENVETALTNKQKPVPFNTRTRKQGGGVYFGKQEEAQLDNMASREEVTRIPPNPVAADVVEKALTEGRDGKLWTYMQSGATSAAMKTGSAAIKAASEIIQNGVKSSEQAIRQFVFPAEHALRVLPKADLKTLSDIMMDEARQGRRFDADLLESVLTVKQLDAYVNMRNMFDDTLAAQNAARAAKNQEPISPNEAYMASRWRGDFRRPVHDAKGNLVWYLAANSKIGLEQQTKALLKKFPDLVVDPKKDHPISSTTGKTDLQSMYTTMLDLLGRNDPAVEKIRKAIEEQSTTEAEAVLAQSKHFEHKAGIKGFVGERPGFEGPKEALAMFQEQIQYAKNAYRWSEMQKAADSLKGIISDERLQDQQPNNVKYIREYFKNAIGHGESKAMRQLEDSFREGLGVSPKVVNEAVGSIKSLFILQKLGASAGYSMANMIQTSNVLPYLADLRAKGFKGNPAIALAVGVPTGIAMTASHYIKALGGEYTSLLPNRFFKEAFQYAENNGVTSRSIYDEGPLAGSFGGVARVGELLGKTMTAPEVMVRSMAFMTYAQMLKDSGKFSDHNKMFQKAEEYVNKSMVDYRETERPMVFSKLGGAGNFLNTLQTYPMSFYNQYAYMGHEAFKNKNPAPLIVSLALQGAVAGAMGLPYMDDTYKLFMFLKDNLAPTGMWAEMQKSPLLSDPKLWMMETLGKSAVYGALSENTGLGLTSRVAAPGMGAMAQSPVGPAVDIAKQVGALGSAVLDPTNTQKWAQSGMKSIPTGLQGLLETTPFMKDHTFIERPDGKKVFMKTTDLAAREGKYARTPEEIAARRWGLRSQKEVVESEVAYATEHADQVLKQKSGALVGQYYDAVRRGDLKTANARSTLYNQLTGKEISDAQAEAEVVKEFTTKSERILKKEGSPQEILNAARMQKLISTEFSQ